MFDERENPHEQNISTERDLDYPQSPANDNNQLNETERTEETIIINEGAEDDEDIKSTSQNKNLNEEIIKDIVNSKEEELTPIEKKDAEIEQNAIKPSAKKSSKINMNNYLIKNPRKKISSNKQKLEEKEKNKNDENTDELFKKAIENASRNFPPIEHDNNLSVKVTEVLYDKYVGKNLHKSKHLDIYSKFKDEAILQQREWNRTKDDAKKISDMIERQEKYEEIKHDKKIGRQRELKNKIKKECVFIPNGKKDNIIQEKMRTPSDFYSDQKKYVAKTEEYINKLAKDKIDGEEKQKKMVSKNSEKMANNKNPNETLDQFCKRLAEERLKNKKETLDNNKKEEPKKMTKKEMQTLTEKLHKEGETFKINRERREKEIFDKLKDSRNKKNFVLEKSTKVIFDKFINEYDKIINELFNGDNTEQKNNKNYEINYDEYKQLLNNLGFIKSDNINNNTKENENVKNKIDISFNEYLKPKDGKIDTDQFLAFCLAVLGIYKGKDEKIIEPLSRITPKLKPEEELKENEKEEKPDNITENKNNNNNNQAMKKQIKSSTEFIKLYLPNLDLDKYGFTEKECNMIKSEFFVFILGISQSWSKDFVKKKQERLDKNELTNKRNNAEELKKLENKLKTNEEFIGAFRRKLLNEEFPSQNDKEKDSNNNTLKKSFRVEDMFEILEKKKKRELDTLKAKKEEDINKECTFHPNYKNKPINKKEVAKNIEKLYQEGKNSLIKKRQLEQETNLNPIEKDCTFKPVIQDYKGDYFENNPLKKDKLFNTEIKKMEKIREEKGYTNKQIKKQMAFNIEPKSNKDNINERVAQNRGEKVVNNVENEFIDYGNFDDKGNQVMIKIEVNLENNKNEILIIQPGEDYLKVVDKFCLKHELNEDKKIRLIRAIKDKMRKNEN